MLSRQAAAGGSPALLVSKAWIQGAALVVLFGFFVLGLLAYRTYVAGPPIPAVVLAEDGAVVFSGEDVTQGQRIFLRAGLMEFGSVFGHGAYLGPDFTADYLRRSAVDVTETYERAGERNVAARVVSDFKTNRYDPASGTLRFTAAQARAFADVERHYIEFFGKPVMDGVGRLRRATRQELLVHEQLARRVARTQSTDRRRARLQHALARGSARWIRLAVRGVWTVGVPRVAPT